MICCPLLTRWRVITSVEQKEKSQGEEQLASYAREYIAKVENALQKIREGVLALMDKKLVPSPSTDESKAFYYRMKSDYYRHLAEFATGKTRSKAGEDAGVDYAEATKIAENDLALSSVVAQRQIPIDQTIEIPAVSLAENVVEMPVTQTQEKMQQAANTHVQHVVNTIKVQKPVIQQKITETSQLQFLNKVDEMPVAVERQNHMIQTVQMPMETPQLPCIDKVVDVPVATQQVVHVPQERVVEKIVEIPQLQIVGEIVRDTQISDSLGTAPVRQGVQAEIGEVVEIRAPVPAESRPPIFVTAPVLEIPVVEQCQALNIQTEQKTIDVPQIQCLEPLVDVSVVTQQTVEIPVIMLKQVPTLQRIQKMVEVPQIQYIDKVVDALVEMQSASEVEHVASTLATEREASTSCH